MTDIIDWSKLSGSSSKASSAPAPKSSSDVIDWSKGSFKGDSAASPEAINIDWGGAAAPKIPNTEPKTEMPQDRIKGLHFWNTSAGDIPAVSEAPELTFGLPTRPYYEAKLAPSTFERKLNITKDTNPILRMGAHWIGGAIDIPLGLGELANKTASELSETKTLPEAAQYIGGTALDLLKSIPVAVISDFRHPDVFINNPAQAAMDISMAKGALKAGVGVTKFAAGKAVRTMATKPNFDIEKMPKETPYTHYSKNPALENLDPQYAGTGQAGSELTTKANYPKEYVPKTYLYDPKAAVESRFQQGQTKYQVTDAGNVLKGKDADFQTILDKTNKKATNSYGIIDRDLRDQLFFKEAKDQGYDTVDLGEGQGAVSLTPRPVRKAFDVTPQGIQGDYTIITAQNPAAPTMGEFAKGVDPNLYLLKELTDKGYKPIPVKGMYGGAAEDSFIVPDLKGADAHKLMLKYGQQAVVTDMGLLDRDGVITPHKDFNLSDKPFSDNYTMLNTNGKPSFFQMGFEENNQTLLGGLRSVDGKARVAPIPMSITAPIKMPKPIASEIMPDVLKAFQESPEKVSEVLREKFPGFSHVPEVTDLKQGYAGESWSEHVKNIMQPLKTAAQLGAEGQPLLDMTYQTIMDRMKRMDKDYGYQINEANPAQSYISKIIPNFGKSLVASVNNVGDFIQEVSKVAQTMVDPSSLSKASRLAADSLRGELAESARRSETLHQVTDAGEKAMDKMSDTAKLQAAWNFENGKSLGHPALDEQIAKPLRDASADRINRLHKLSPTMLSEAIANYLGRIYKRDSVMKYELKQSLIDSEKLAFVPKGKNAPKGFMPIEDHTFGKYVFDPKTGTFSEVGRYYANQDVANLINTSIDGIVKNPNNFASIMQGRKPLEGMKTFMKPRTFLNMTDAMAEGLVPEDLNFVRSTNLKLAEMDRYYAAHSWLNSLKESKLARGYKLSERPVNPNWVKIDDPIGSYFMKTEDGHYVKAGQWWADKDAATILNNHLGKGLQQFPIYRAARAIFNGVNQLTLGLSFFHGGFVADEVMVSRLAKTAQQMAAGDFKGAASSFTTMPLPVEVATNFSRGTAAWEEYLKPGSHPEIEPVVRMLVKGGMRVGMDRQYAIGMTDVFSKAVREAQIGQAAFAFPGAVLETVAKPLMQIFVPKEKIGASVDLLKREMDDPKWETYSELQKARISSEIVETMDNRFGQLVYDNTFMNKIMKDIMMIEIRALGWNLGTWRMAAGVVTDIERLMKDVEAGRPTKLTPNLAYAMALPAYQAFVGAIYQYAHTGTAPQEPRDYFQPKNGEKDSNGIDMRTNPPSYLRDIASYMRDPMGTLAGKMHPMSGMIYEFMANKDSQGTELRGLDDGLMQQMIDLTGWMKTKLMPMGIQQSLKTIKNMPVGESMPMQVERTLEPLFGFTPAAKNQIASDAENTAGAILSLKRPIGSRTHAQALKMEEERDIRLILRPVFTALKGGELDAKTLDFLKSKSPRLKEIITSGNLSLADIRSSMKRSQESTLVGMTTTFTVLEMGKVWDKATPEEKKLLTPIILKKMLGTMQTGSVNEQKAMIPLGKRLMKEGYLNAK